MSRYSANLKNRECAQAAELPFIAQKNASGKSGITRRISVGSMWRLIGWSVNAQARLGYPLLVKFKPHLNVPMTASDSHCPLSLQHRFEIIVFIEDLCNAQYLDALSASSLCQQDILPIFAVNACEVPPITLILDSREFWAAKVQQEGTVFSINATRILLYLNTAKNDSTIKLATGMVKHGLCFVGVIARLKFCPFLQKKFYVISATFSSSNTM